MNNQEILLKIVKTWDLNPRPEFRGFRCANCQKSLRKAWYHWLDSGGYKTPVHFCNNCETKFIQNIITAENPSIKVDYSIFLTYPSAAKLKLLQISSEWNTKAGPFFKTFTCDTCGNKIHKAYHVCDLQNTTLVEAHFCRICGDQLGLGKL